MADNRTTEYATTREVTDLWRPGTTYGPASINATSGLGQANPNRIMLALADIQSFTPGDYIRIYDDSKPIGETVQIQDVVEDGATSYLEAISNLTNAYTVAASGSVSLLSAFTSRATASITGGSITTETKPSAQEVNRVINEVEQYIEAYTRYSWQTKTISNETHDYPMRRYTPRDWLDGLPVKLNYRDIVTAGAVDGSGSRVLDTSAGDKLEIWTGSTFEDWLTTRTGSRKGMHWVDAQKGIVYLRSFYKLYGRVSVRVTYRTGTASTIPQDIQRAAALLAVAQLLATEDSTVSIPGGGDINIISVTERAKNYKEEAHIILDRYKEMVNIW